MLTWNREKYTELRVGRFRTRLEFKQALDGVNAGISLSALQSYESGAAKPQRHKWPVLCQALGCDLSEITDDTAMALPPVKPKRAKAQAQAAPALPPCGKPGTVPTIEITDLKSIGTPDFSRAVIDTIAVQFPQARYGDYCVKVTENRGAPLYPDDAILLVRKPGLFDLENGEPVVAVLPDTKAAVVAHFVQTPDAVRLVAPNRETVLWEAKKSGLGEMLLFRIVAAMRDERAFLRALYAEGKIAPLWQSVTD